LAQKLNAGTTRLLQVTPPWDFDVSQGSIWAPVIEVKNPDAFITKNMFGLLQAGNIFGSTYTDGLNSEEI
jgi:hypothetical protein